MEDKLKFLQQKEKLLPGRSDRIEDQHKGKQTAAKDWKSFRSGKLR